MECFTLKANSLPDAWFQLVYNLMRAGAPRSTYVIDKGSYVGQRRLEFQFVTIQIDNPGIRPLIPEIPPMLNIPAPVESMDYVNDYFARYLMSTELAENETYIYGTWLAPGIERVIEQLKGAPGNNQASISLGGFAPYHRDVVDGMLSYINTDNFIDPGTGQRDPACMRLVDFRLDQTNTLHMVLYFRSWDLWGGFPANLAGMQLVKEYVGQALGANDGRIIACSKGLHLYDYSIQVAAERLGMGSVDTDGFFDWLELEVL